VVVVEDVVVDVVVVVVLDVVDDDVVDDVLPGTLDEVVVDEVVVLVLDVLDDDVLDDVLPGLLDEVGVSEVDDVVIGNDDVVPVPSVVVVVSVVDVVEDIPGIGQACPAGRGVQMSVSVFLSTRFGCSPVLAITVIFRFLACRARALSLRMSSVKGPHVELVRGGTLTADAGLVVTLRSNPGLQPSVP
jgi:hypothetical protein